MVQRTSGWASFQNLLYLCDSMILLQVVVAADEVQLDVFVDASSSTHEAIAYLRISKGSEIDVAFVVSRIDATYCLPLSARRLVIMPQHHHDTRLLVSHCHKKLHNQKDSLTIKEMRQKFWTYPYSDVYKEDLPTIHCSRCQVICSDDSLAPCLAPNDIYPSINIRRSRLVWPVYHHYWPST